MITINEYDFKIGDRVTLKDTKHNNYDNLDNFEFIITNITYDIITNEPVYLEINNRSREYFPIEWFNLYA